MFNSKRSVCVCMCKQDANELFGHFQALFVRLSKCLCGNFWGKEVLWGQLWPNKPTIPFHSITTIQTVHKLEWANNVIEWHVFARSWVMWYRVVAVDIGPILNLLLLPAQLSLLLNCSTLRLNQLLRNCINGMLVRPEHGQLTAWVRDCSTAKRWMNENCQNCITRSFYIFLLFDHDDIIQTLELAHRVTGRCYSIENCSNGTTT